MDVISLVDNINNDLLRNGSYDRYPVRFFSMSYDEGTSDSIIHLQKKLDSIDIFDIKDILPHEDAWITADNLRKNIYELDKFKSFIVIGFSEYARFLEQSEFTSLLISLLELENSEENTKRRIYIPCFALYSQIKRIIKTYNRRAAIFNPFLNETDVEDLPRIYFVNEGLNVNYEANEVVNSAEWFGMWRNAKINTKHPIICTSRTLAHFYSLASPDNVYNIQYLKTYQDILKKMYLIDNLHAYKKNPDDFFYHVITLINSSGIKELRQLILTEVNAQSIDASNIFYLWKTCDTFKKWLIQNYILIYSVKNTYLYKIMESLDELTDIEFIEKMYTSIFDYKDLSMVEERRVILASIKNVEKDIIFTYRMVAYYNSLIIDIIHRKTTILIDSIDFTKEDEILADKQSTLSDTIIEEIAPYLTSFSGYERQLTIWLYRMKIISETQIKDIYPSLWDYMNGNNSNCVPEEFASKFNHYFMTYRKIRLAQKNGNEYDTALSIWNRDENTFYDWYLCGKIEYPEIFLKKKNFTGTVYVLDGVGAEFLGYIHKLLEKRGYFAETLAYGKCHLPSTTNVAKRFYPSEYEWILDYDVQVNHSGAFYHVYNVEKGLSVIENVIDRIINTEGDTPFAITADHGSSVGHKLQKKEKKYDFDKSEHDGRCYYNKDGQYIDNSTDYIVYDDDIGKQWVIALNQRSLYNNSKYAVHGGATLEEVLVPIIIVHKGKQISKTYRVNAIDLKVSGLKKKVEFSIYPMHKNVTAILRAKDGTNANLTYNEETKTWTGELKRGIEQEIEISIGEQIFMFKTVPPTKMGDDLFDE